ncbi:MAG: DUF2279 domain-containing protein [Bacteroidales bacterium]|nr:DUF2279 domain-containing protein [Bacteroidales bacterium]
MRRPAIQGICLCILLICFFSNQHGWCQKKDSLSSDSTPINKDRLTKVLAVEGAVYLGTLGGLYFAWYQNYPQSSFHLFNDNGEWMQMDKIAHTTTAYYISRIGYATYRWSGLKPKTSIWLGGALGFAYMLNIEILDGFSSEWGFSLGDLTANTLGCAIFIGQQLGWDEQRFVLKYSYHPTQYPPYRPDLLGDNIIQNLIKDYNGMTFWLSGNIHSFLPEESKFPRWLNIAFGYGAEGMTGAYGNTLDYKGNTIPELDRYRKFFFSIDVDLTRIRTRSKVLKGIFTVLSFIKIPAPAIEYNTLGQVKFHPFYF